jgi:hypothetical protein
LFVLYRLIIWQACEFLFSYGFVELGNECHKLTLQAEASVTAKAAARGMPSNTVPFIKHVLKRAGSALLLAAPARNDNMLQQRDRLSSAIDVARESVDSSADNADVARGYLALAKAQTLARSDPAEICDSYCRAFEASNNTDSNGMRPFCIFD